MRNKEINCICYDEMDFLKMYLTLFQNFIDPNVDQKWKIDKEDTRLYEFCHYCIERIKLLIDYSIKKGNYGNKPSIPTLDIAVAYQTLLEYIEGEKFNRIIYLEEYGRNKRILLQDPTICHNDIFARLFKEMEEEMPAYIEGLPLHETKEEKQLRRQILKEHIQNLRGLIQLQKLQEIENQLFFITADEAKQELNDKALSYIKNKKVG